MTDAIVERVTARWADYTLPGAGKRSGRSRPVHPGPLWANSATRRLYEEGTSRKFRGLDLDAALELLAILDAAPSLQDLSPLRSIGLHKLKGDRKGQWAMTVNGPWRLCFRFVRGDAHGVEIVDYHEG